MSVNKRPLATTVVGGTAFIAMLVAGIKVHESWTETPVIPTRGDVPTIGHGTTVYPDGTRVKMGDPPITRQQAEAFVYDHVSKDVERFSKTIQGLHMWPHEVYASLDFTYQFGMARWTPNSSMLKNFKAGNYQKACDSFLLYRRQGGRDCSDPIAGGWGKPWGCKGVWLRQQQRHQLCLGNITIEEYKNGL